MLYVNPSQGSDRASGSQTQPYKTLTHALRQARAGTSIQLANGIYSTATGETFPLHIPSRVKVLGNPAAQGQGIIVEGSGSYNSATFAQQNVTLTMADAAELWGVTVTNRASKGTAIWLESTDPVVGRNTLIDCGREGAFVTGNAMPVILDNIFVQNAASGLSIWRNGKGEVRRNQFRRTGYGIAISDDAAPLLAENRIVENRSGIVVSRSARPVLRGNLVEANTNDGLVVLNSAVPDLGSSQDLGENILRNNGRADLHNSTTIALISVGNQLNPTRTQGRISFVASEVAAPRQAPTLAPTPGTDPPDPSPDPTPDPTPERPDPTPDPVTPPSGLTRFPDLDGHWAERFAQWFINKGIVRGFLDGTFRPDAGVTRAQYAAVLAATFPFENPPTTGSLSAFSDVSSSFWAAEAIRRTRDAGFLSGFPDGTFRPNQSLSRVEVIVSLVNGLNLTGGRPDSLLVYRDRALIPPYATGPVGTATERKMVVNHPDIRFIQPLEACTRAEMLAMVYQSLVAQGDVSLISSPFIVQPNGASPSFTDVQNHWAEPFIRGLAGLGLVNGFADGSFQPDGIINRAQYAALLVSAFNPPSRRASVNFVDISPNFWAREAIQQAYQGEFLSGFPDGTFGPDQPALRWQILLSLVSGLGIPDGPLSVLDTYGDRSEIPSFAKPAIATATQRQFVVNYPRLTQLNPNRRASRAEVVAMIYQALVNQQRAAAIDSPYIVKPDIPAQATVVFDPAYEDAEESDEAPALSTEDRRAIAQQVTQVLAQQGIRTVISGDRPAVTTTQLAEQSRAQVLVGLQAPPTSSNASGIETYCYAQSAADVACAQAIHQQILQTVDIRDKGIQNSEAYVLRQTSMPAVLLQLDRLTQSSNVPGTEDLGRLGAAIALGILQYLQSSSLSS